ncbi:MAG: glycoside hydrolase family 13 [Verrucomicrobia bacterium]|nr:glycoside hydrolase family 13 [Verrucomicrobiota bacterium]
MNSKPTPPLGTGGAEGNYSARRPKHSVVFFTCDAPHANNVSLVGDFNNWQPDANPMQRMPDGCWTVRLELRHGSYRYLFLVDGKPMLDPRAQGVVHEPNPLHEAASLIVVS